MHKKKAYILIKSFKKAEFKEFTKYLNSPFFNINHNIVKLYKYIDVHLKSSDHTPLVENEIYFYLFGDNKINPNKLNKVFLDLAKSIKDYLYIKTCQEKDLEKRLNSSEYCLKIRNNTLLKSYLKNLKNEIAKTKFKDYEHFYNEIQINRLQTNYLAVNNNRALDENIYESFKAINNSFLLQKLELLIYKYNRANIFNIDTDDTEFNSCISILKNIDLTKEPYISIQLEVVYFLKNKNKLKHYENLKRLLILHQDQIRKNDLINIYIALSNNLRHIFKGG